MKIHVTYSLAHLKPDLRPLHGPQTWPWWKLVSMSICEISWSPLSSGRRLWIYTRWGAVHVDVILDKRKRPL